LEGPFSYMGPGVAKLVIMGKRQSTPNSILRDHDRMDQAHESLEAGAGLGPCAATERWGCAPFSGWVERIPDARDHTWLCAEEHVITLTKAILHRPAPPAPAPSVQPSMIATTTPIPMPAIPSPPPAP